MFSITQQYLIFRLFTVNDMLVADVFFFRTWEPTIHDRMRLEKHLKFTHMLRYRIASTVAIPMKIEIKHLRKSLSCNMVKFSDFTKHVPNGSQLLMPESDQHPYVDFVEIMEGKTVAGGAPALLVLGLQSTISTIGNHSGSMRWIKTFREFAENMMQTRRWTRVVGSLVMVSRSDDAKHNNFVPETKFITELSDENKLWESKLADTADAMCLVHKGNSAISFWAAHCDMVPFLQARNVALPTVTVLEPYMTWTCKTPLCSKAPGGSNRSFMCEEHKYKLFFTVFSYIFPGILFQFIHLSVYVPIVPWVWTTRVCLYLNAEIKCYE
jgi:hypothetical protein